MFGCPPPTYCNQKEKDPEKQTMHVLPPETLGVHTPQIDLTTTDP
jgi:hypothetical protein